MAFMGPVSAGAACEKCSLEIDAILVLEMWQLEAAIKLPCSYQILSKRYQYLNLPSMGPSCCKTKPLEQVIVGEMV